MVAAVIALLVRASAIGLVVLAAQSSLAATGTQPAAVAAAKDWLTLVDRQRWGASWTNAGALFHGQVNQARWVIMIKAARAPIGTVVARTFKSVSAASSLPGAPDGQYQIVQYATRFARKREASETIILNRERSGWKVAGYFLR